MDISAMQLVAIIMIRYELYSNDIIITILPPEDRVERDR